MYLVLEGKGGREGEKHQCERDIDWLPLAHPLGTKPRNSGLCSDR